MKLLFLMCSIISGSVIASDWEIVYNDQDNTIFILIDKQSIATSGNLKKAWIAYNYAEPQKTKEYPYKEYSSTKDLHMFNCEERTSGIAQYTLYKERLGKGDVVESVVYSKSKIVYSEIIPDTIGEGNLNFVCSYQNKHRKNVVESKK